MKMPRFSARKKNQDNMVLFLSDSDFRDDVRQMRIDFQIPEEALVMGSPKAIKWMREFEKGDLFRFDKAMRMMVDRYMLPANYAHYIQNHIIYGTENAPPNNFDIIPFSRQTDPLNQPRHITINVYAHLTKEEYVDLREELDRLGKELPVFRPLKDVKRKIEREKKALQAQKINEDGLLYGDKPFTYGEVLGDKKGARKEGVKARENLRELKDLRKTRYRKK